MKAGFVASLGRPGGNLTGVNMFSVEMQAKRLGILHELIPPTMVIANLVTQISPQLRPRSRSADGGSHSRATNLGA